MPQRFQANFAQLSLRLLLSLTALFGWVNANSLSAHQATADGKPLWKVKGTPTGAIHGGLDGTPFKDKARGRLAQVSIRAVPG